jgi:hypothetical protein
MMSLQVENHVVPAGSQSMFDQSRLSPSAFSISLKKVAEKSIVQEEKRLNGPSPKGKARLRQSIVQRNMKVVDRVNVKKQMEKVTSGYIPSNKRGGSHSMMDQMVSSTLYNQVQVYS